VTPTRALRQFLPLSKPCSVSRAGPNILYSHPKTSLHSAPSAMKASSVSEGVGQLGSSVRAFAAAAEVNTAVIEAYRQRVMEILTGTAK
jgi:hypothetical protein